LSRKIIISQSAYDETFDYFINQGFEVIKFHSMNKPYEAVADHPDMFMVYDDKLFLEGDVKLEGIHCSRLGEKYPETVKYNVAIVGSYAIGKKSALDKTLFKHLEGKYDFLDVNQGYAKCSTAIIGKKIITSDLSIYKACSGKIDALLIDEGHILLPGLNHGFIGGTCVAFDDTVFFNGDITKHINYDAIKAFIDPLRISYVDKPLRDIGSFIIIERSD